ncbi:PQQ-binding-like beta-propeller repeat protein [Stratiformator vulcanicus]|uniref:Outer membrane biogenesis protein BamB n=1 Tax=Stratiformator vulcanicus TaxID=2527980 RepID=A0A517R584_9PLAN|nr:PQQ-binding-like beta-propeller repeat protein [Stratiformator vulcanicus]QDT38983.1 outer membrane biogenesis protein BamB [Stratiformator vulcanicus]
MTRRIVAGFGLILSALVSPIGGVPAAADDWPQWFGPNRDGIWREAGVSTSLPDDASGAAWRAPVKAGYAAPAVAGGRVYLMDRTTDPLAVTPDNPFLRGDIPGTERVVCVDDATGEELWVHQYDCAYTVSYPLGPRVTPTISGGRVYSLGAEGDFKCLDAETGEVIWEKDFNDDYQADTPMWGFSSHPLVDGNKVITHVGGEGSAVVAWNKNTGEELWRSLTVPEIGYAPPVIYEAGGVRQLVSFHGGGVSGLNPETGEEYWTVEIEVPFAMAIALPQKSGDKLLVTPYQRNTKLLQFAADTPTVKTVWTSTNRTGVHPTIATAYIVGDYVYGNGLNGWFRCFKLADGDRVWETLEPTTGDRPERWSTVFLTPHEPSGKYFLYNEHCELMTAELSPEGYKELDRVQLLKPTATAGNRDLVWSHPAYANKSVYVRNDEELIKVSLAE